jgi:hypothetical protein
MKKIYVKPNVTVFYDCICSLMTASNKEPEVTENIGAKETFNDVELDDDDEGFLSSYTDGVYY